jgi:hypothetical protein
MLDVANLAVALVVWVGVVLVHGAWRSRGDAGQDPIRPSGPIVRG